VGDPWCGHVEDDLAPRPGDPDRQLVLVAERPERQRGPADRRDRAAVEPDRHRVVELDASARAGGEGGDLGGPQRDEPLHQAERVGELALAVAAARDQRIRPRLTARQRRVRVAEIGGADGQQVAHDRRHRDVDVLDLADDVLVLDEPPGLLGDAHLVPGVAEHDVDAALAGEALDRPGLGRVDGERLLGEDVDPGLDGGQHLAAAEVAGPGDRDDVGPGGDDLLPVGRGPGEAKPLAGRLEQRRVAAVDDQGLDLRPAQEARDVGRCGPRAGADDAEGEAAAGCRFGSSHGLLHSG